MENFFHLLISLIHRDQHAPECFFQFYKHTSFRKLNIPHNLHINSKSSPSKPIGHKAATETRTRKRTIKNFKGEQHNTFYKKINAKSDPGGEFEVEMKRRGSRTS